MRRMHSSHMRSALTRIFLLKIFELVVDVSNSEDKVMVFYAIKYVFAIYINISYLIIYTFHDLGY